MMVSCNTFAQKTKKEQREIQEITLIYEDYVDIKLKIPYSDKNGWFLTLPAYFKNYKGFNDKKKYDKIDLFNYVNFKKSFLHLTKSDCKELNNAILNDTNRLYIQRNWFGNKNVVVLSDSITKLEEKQAIHLMKPIFFRNYTRCFMAKYYPNGMESYFLKKENNKWVFDTLVKVVDYD